MVDAARLPDTVESGARGGPTFSTSVITFASGRESRQQEWQVARHTWDVAYGITNEDDYALVRDFFYACGGRARSFLFKDWSDFKGKLEPVAAVTGNANQRQLIKTYGNGVSSYLRVITHPVTGTVRVFVDTVEVAPVSISSAGVITFGSDPGDNVVATFEFDIPVRFDSDDLAVTMHNVVALELPSIQIIEVTNDE